MDNRQGNILEWVILIVTTLTLILTYQVYNRTGEDLGTVVEQNAKEAVEDAQFAAARAKAYARLVAIRAELAAELTAAEAADEVAEVEADLEEAYAEASVEAKQEWKELKTDFDQSEAELRDDTADALAGLTGLINSLEADVRTDDE